MILVGGVELGRADHRNRLYTVGGLKAKSTGFREEATHFLVLSALIVPIGEVVLSLEAKSAFSSLDSFGSKVFKDLDVTLLISFFN